MCCSEASEHKENFFALGETPDLSVKRTHVGGCPSRSIVRSRSIDRLGRSFFPAVLVNVSCASRLCPGSAMASPELNPIPHLGRSSSSSGDHTVRFRSIGAPRAVSTSALNHPVVGLLFRVLQTIGGYKTMNGNVLWTPDCSTKGNLNF